MRSEYADAYRAGCPRRCAGRPGPPRLGGPHRRDRAPGGGGAVRGAARRAVRRGDVPQALGSARAGRYPHRCGPDDCSQALTTSLTLTRGTLFLGGILTFCARLTARLLPWRTRWSVPRAWAAVVSVLPPLFVLAPVLTLPEG
ncbi:hypothetical protein [Streptomyces sp. enrichment culture]|uniref:hypothetical protein n=1 Tax=Streptomyces sp. enrichment culture TaxID=1795815 RepID=UPI003F548672